MSADELRRMKALQEAQAAQIQRLNLQLQAQSARNEEDEEVVEFIDPNFNPQNPGAPVDQMYNRVTQDQMVMNHLANQAAERAAQKVQQNLQSTQSVQTSIQKRMERLVAEYPAIQEDDSALTQKAREVYARITAENPTINEADKYELAVREAASRIGARPVNQEFDPNQDFVMPSSTHNPAKGSGRSGKLNRLTDNILQNAMVLGINVDPKTKEGQENLKELNDYSARFDADRDETPYRYR